MPVPSLTRRALVLGALAAGAAACSSGRTSTPDRAAAASPSGGSPSAAASPSPSPSPSPAPAPATPAAIAARATVPVLCWHQLRPWRAGDSAYSKRLLICPPANFRAQLDALSEGGYTTISPDTYLQHLLTGAALPAKPVLLSFDDSQGTQATEALPQLVKREMTATFFAMTVVLGKKDWLSADDLRRIDAAGMTVAAHTYDHHRVDRYSGGDWAEQLQRPRAELEKIVGKPVEHFAYPYGAWNAAALPQVKAAGYRSAYQLMDDKLDPATPLYTLRRVLMDSTWNGRQLLANMTA